MERGELLQFSFIFVIYTRMFVLFGDVVIIIHNYLFFFFVVLVESSSIVRQHQRVIPIIYLSDSFLLFFCRMNEERLYLCLFKLYEDFNFRFISHFPHITPVCVSVSGSVAVSEKNKMVTRSPKQSTKFKKFKNLKKKIIQDTKVNLNAL